MHFVGYLYITGLIKAHKMEHIKIHWDINTKPDFLPPNIYSDIHSNYQTFSPNIATPKYGVPLSNCHDGICVCVCVRERERESVCERVQVSIFHYCLKFIIWPLPLNNPADWTRSTTSLLYSLLWCTNIEWTIWPSQLDKYNTKH